MAKRDREKKVQFWLDPEDAGKEARALETVAYFMKEHNMSQKEVYMWGIEVLRAAEWRNDFLTEDTRISMLQRHLERLIERLERGEFSNMVMKQEAMQDVEQARKDLTEMEKSTANRYRELDFDNE